MAVYAAHLTRTLQGTPSVFQVTAQEALGATVKPALKKVVQYLSESYPNKFGWCLRWFDELYLIFDYSLQYHYLKHNGASFSESFYGLLRVPTSSSDFHSGQRLPDVLEKSSLVLLVLMPYIKDKVERVIQRWREDEEDGRLQKNTSGSARKAAIRLFSAVHLVVEASKLVQLGLYLTGRVRSHSPALAALGLALRNAPAREELHYTWTDLFSSIFTGNLGSAALGFPLLGGLLLRGVEYGAFAVQLLRWWEAHGSAPSAVLPPPPPPPRSRKAAAWRNRCPLCRQAWRTPTALPVSGYVFCYTCISRHVRQSGACPATRLPAHETSLVRLYLD